MLTKYIISQLQIDDQFRLKTNSIGELYQSKCQNIFSQKDPI